MHQQHIPIGRHRRHDTRGRRAVSCKIHRRTTLRIPGGQLSPSLEELALGRTLHEMHRERTVAPCNSCTERLLLQGVGRMRSDRTGESVCPGTLRQRLHPLRRNDTQSEKFEKIPILHFAPRLKGERRVAVADIADTPDPLPPQPAVGLRSRLQSLFRAFHFAHVPHAAGKSRKTAARGNGAFQMGKFQMTMGVDQVGNENAVIELDLRTGIQPARDLHTRHPAVTRPRDYRIAEQRAAMVHVMGGEPPSERSILHIPYPLSSTGRYIRGPISAGPLPKAAG